MAAMRSTSSCQDVCSAKCGLWIAFLLSMVRNCVSQFGRRQGKATVLVDDPQVQPLNTDLAKRRTFQQPTTVHIRDSVYELQNICVVFRQDSREDMDFAMVGTRWPKEIEPPHWFEISETRYELSQDKLDVYGGTTLLFGGFTVGSYSNPTHLLWNYMQQFALAKVRGSMGSVQQVFYSTPGIVKSPTESLWDWQFAKRLGLIGKETVLVPNNKNWEHSGAPVCFERLLWPRQDCAHSYWPEDTCHGIQRWINQRLTRRTLDKEVQFKTQRWLKLPAPEEAEPCTVIIMDRSDMSVRRWTDAQRVYTALLEAMPHATIHYFNSSNPLSKLSPAQQFDLFSKTQIFIGPHGGVEGASIAPMNWQLYLSSSAFPSQAI